MIHTYPPAKLIALRKRSHLTQMQVVELTGINKNTLHNLEHGKHKPQTSTLDKLLTLYALRIKRLEKLDEIWGEDGTRPAQSAGVVASPRPSTSTYQAKPIAGNAGRGLPNHALKGTAGTWNKR